MPALRDPEPGSRRATRRSGVARTFALACRLLPRELRDDVYRLYLVFRTLDDLVDDGDPRASERVAAVEAWCARRRRRARARRGSSRALDDAARPAARRAARLLPRHARRPRRHADRAPRTSSTTYCYRVAGTVGVVMAALLGTRDRASTRARPPPRSARRCSARTSCATSTRTSRHGRIYLRQRDASSASARSSPARARRWCATRSRAPTPSTTRASPGSRCSTSGRRAIRAAAAMYREILRQIEREGYGAARGARRRAALAQAARGSAARPRAADLDSRPCAASAPSSPRSSPPRSPTAACRRTGASPRRAGSSGSCSRRRPPTPPRRAGRVRGPGARRRRPGRWAFVDRARRGRDRPAVRALHVRPGPRPAGRRRAAARRGGLGDDGAARLGRRRADRAAPLRRVAASRPAR